MSELIHLRADVWAVKVPDDSHRHYIGTGKGTFLVYYTSFVVKRPFIKLPPGSYRLIGIYPGMDWKSAVEIVEHENDGSGLSGWWYKNYKSEVPWWFKDPLESLASLFASKSLTGRYAVIKKD